MRWTGRTTVVGLSLMMLLAFSGGAQAAKENWEGYLVAPLLPGTPVDMCDPYDSCQGLEGVTVETIDVSEGMEQHDGPADYLVLDMSSPQPITVWRFCMYDANQSLLECHEEGPHWYLWGEVPEETREVRIILAQNAAVEWYFKLDT